MKRNIKKIISLVLVLAMSFAICVPAFAVEKSSSKPAKKTEKIYDASSFNQHGNLSEAQRQACKEENCTRNHNNNGVSTRHFNINYHTHEVTKITNQYTGQRDRGVRTSCRQTSAPAVLNLSETRTVTNNFSVNIGFSKDAVEAAVGYTFGQGWSELASYSINVPAGKSGEIRLYDIYDVKEFNVETTYYGSMSTTGSRPTWKQNGTGWAEQWLRFDFSGRIY